MLHFVPGARGMKSVKGPESANAAPSDNGLAADERLGTQILSDN